MPRLVVSVTSSSGVGVHLAINSVNALLWIVDVPSNLKPKLDSSKAHSTILPVASRFRNILCNGKTSNNYDLMGLEVVVQFP